MRRLAGALLARDLCAARPVVVLSGNDIEHATLALACLYAGIPFAPISPAYCDGHDNFRRLSHVARSLTPGLIFASDADRCARAASSVFAGIEFITVRQSADCLTAVHPRLDELWSTPETERAEQAFLVRVPTLLRNSCSRLTSANRICAAS